MPFPPLSLYYWKSVSVIVTILGHGDVKVFSMIWKLRLEILSYLYFFIIGMLLIKFKSVSVTILGYRDVKVFFIVKICIIGRKFKLDCIILF